MHRGITKISGIIHLDLKLRSLSPWNKTPFPHNSSPQRNITLPYVETPTKPNTQIFPWLLLQGLRFHPRVRSRSQDLLVDLLKAPWQTEFNSLVRILTDNDLARTPGSTDQAKVGVLWSSSKKLLHGHLHHPAALHHWSDRQHGTPLEGGGWDWQGWVHREVVAVKHLKI